MQDCHNPTHTIFFFFHYLIVSSLRVYSTTRGLIFEPMGLNLTEIVNICDTKNSASLTSLPSDRRSGEKLSVLCLWAILGSKVARLVSGMVTCSVNRAIYCTMLILSTSNVVFISDLTSHTLLRKLDTTVNRILHPIAFQLCVTFSFALFSAKSALSNYDA